MTDAPLSYPREMTPELQEVLGTMVFRCGPIARVFRAAGHEIQKRAEDEQAFVLHWLIRLVLEHGPDWRQRADVELAKAASAAKTA